MNGDGLVAVGIVIAFYGGLLYWLYHLVRRNAHPSRSLLLSFLATLAIVFVSSLFAIAIVVLIVPGIKTLSGLVGLAAAAVAWRHCKRWIASPRSDNPTAAADSPMPAIRVARRSETPASRWPWRFPSFVRWQVVCAAGVMAIIGFLSIHRYEPGPGLIWNIIHAKIFLTHPCAGPDFSDLVPTSFFRRLWDGECGVHFPYSGLLAAAVSMATVALLWPHHKPSEPSPRYPIPTSGPPPIPRRGPPPIPPAT